MVGNDWGLGGIFRPVDTGLPQVLGHNDNYFDDSLTSFGLVEASFCLEVFFGFVCSWIALC